MKVRELLTLLVALLKDEILGSIEENNGEILVTFLDGTKRTITVK